MKKLLVLSLLLLTSPVWACESYEDCKELSIKNLNVNPHNPTNVAVAQLYSNLAIAYKLDEISKKLDNKNNCPTPGCKDLV